MMAKNWADFEDDVNGEDYYQKNEFHESEIINTGNHEATSIQTSTATATATPTPTQNKNTANGMQDDAKTPTMRITAPQPQPQPAQISETIDPNTGIKTIVEHIVVDGQTFRVTRRVKMVKKEVKVNRRIIERRKLSKFGDVAGMPPGPENNVTTLTNESYTLDLKPKKDDKKEDSALTGSSIIICSHCKEPGHFSLKCPRRSQLAPKGIAMPPEPERVGDSLAVGGDGKFVPLHRREGAVREHVNDEDATTLRVTNLSEDTAEHDVVELFSRFGRISRVYLAKDRITGISRGFAFVNFSLRRDAQMAIEKLDGHGYDNLILHVEWAKPRSEIKE